MSVAIEISVGELIDKITILEIKSQRILDPSKAANVQVELGLLSQVKVDSFDNAPELADLTAQLKNVNEQLWDIEDQIRLKERNADFDAEFIRLARSVYKINDSRADIKRRINLLMGSKITEEKSYQEY